ncbi:hypothetical protein Ancab_008469 [Ancistrocladus abbreviatus]
MFSTSDDNAMLNQIWATHAPDGRDIDVKPLLQVIDDIFLLAAPVIPGAAQITCKCSGGGDAHAATLAVFNTVSSYSWDAKVVLALATFAVYHGEFWLVAQLYLSNPLVKSVAIVKQLPEIMERSAYLKP